MFKAGATGPGEQPGIEPGGNHRTGLFSAHFTRFWLHASALGLRAAHSMGFEPTFRHKVGEESLSAVFPFR